MIIKVAWVACNKTGCWISELGLEKTSQNYCAQLDNEDARLLWKYCIRGKKKLIIHYSKFQKKMFQKTVSVSEPEPEPKTLLIVWVPTPGRNRVQRASILLSNLRALAVFQSDDKSDDVSDLIARQREASRFGCAELAKAAMLCIYQLELTSSLRLFRSICNWARTMVLG